MVKPKRLLAKPDPKPKQWTGLITFTGHTSSVIRAASTVMKFLGKRIEDHFHVDATQLKRLLRLSALIHDLGKLNNHFQFDAGIRPKLRISRSAHLLRHELLSGLIAWELQDYFTQSYTLEELRLAIAAAIGHHDQAGKDYDDLVNHLRTLEKSDKYRDRLKAVIYLDHDDFNSFQRYALKEFGLTPQKYPRVIWTTEELRRRLVSLQRELETIQPSKQLSVLKALLFASDGVGSAKPKSLERFIKKSLHQVMSLNDIEEIIQYRLGKHQPYSWQNAAQNVKGRVAIATGGTGNGKTILGYCFAKTHAEGKKLIFCYPTMGTSTAGFLDYATGGIEATLQHSNAEIDLAEHYSNEDLIEESDRKDAFSFWDPKLIICTVDTVLGLLQNQRKGLYGFPAIANSCIVFDEIHMYDARLFGLLLRFLAFYKGSILLMTASLSPRRLALIQDAVGEDIEILTGDEVAENHKRYGFSIAEDAPLNIAETEYQNGGRILWVCNQVKEAQSVAQHFVDKGFNVLVYHSRFEYADRKRVQAKVIDAFNDSDSVPVIAVTTQVCEVSLDLKHATLLVSQFADPAAEIQRLGRLNRVYGGSPRSAIFYPDQKPGYPYPKEVLADGEKLISDFIGSPCSQADLAQWLNQYHDSIDPEWDCNLLDRNWKTCPGQVRVAGYTQGCLLECRRSQWQGLKGSALKPFVVPLIIRKEMESWPTYERYVVAPKATYSYDHFYGVIEQ